MAVLHAIAVEGSKMIVADKVSKDVKKYLEDKKKIVDNRLESYFKDKNNSFDVQALEAALSYTTLLDGKRIRPILAIAVYEMYREDIERVLDPACALELIHAGSLMLDDLPCMDDAKLRRGKKTSHLVFGESVTILASASLWVRAFRILANVEDVRINKLVKLTSDFIGEHGLALGQYLDLFSMGRVQTKDQLEKSYELKTSVLFQLAVQYGGIMGGASENDLELLNEYARHLGIAFQIRDDIIDATQTKEESGKDAHKDEDNHKLNYVSLLGLAGAEEALMNEIKQAEHSLGSIDRDSNLLSEISELLSKY